MKTAGCNKPMTVREIEEGALWEIHSPSGNTHTVTYKGSGDADPEYVALYECTCPAYQFRHGDVCKHIRAVVDWSDAREATDDLYNSHPEDRR